MLTVGVDLAAESPTTAACALSWADGKASVQALDVGVTDERILQLAMSSNKVGIDCPLGWPDPFVEFVVAQRNGTHARPPVGAAKDWRRTLAYRQTDRVVHELTGRWPLSVAADRIAHTAFRAAGLLAQLRDGGRPVDRAGTGVVVEVYPAASLQQWGLASRGYKRQAGVAQLGELFQELTLQAPYLDVSHQHAELCRSVEHAFDALICALTARAAAVGGTRPPDDTQRPVTAREGWIALPLLPLADLPATAGPEPQVSNQRDDRRRRGAG